MILYGRILTIMSNEHILYLKRIKKNKFIVHLFQILIFVILVFLWQILANLGIINTFIYSSPKKVIMTVIDLYNRYNLISHIGITIYEVLISFEKDCFRIFERFLSRIFLFCSLYMFHKGYCNLITFRINLP